MAALDKPLIPTPAEIEAAYRTGKMRTVTPGWSPDKPGAPGPFNESLEEYVADLRRRNDYWRKKNARLIKEHQNDPFVMHSIAEDELRRLAEKRRLLELEELVRERRGTS